MPTNDDRLRKSVKHLRLTHEFDGKTTHPVVDLPPIYVDALMSLFNTELQRRVGEARLDELEQVKEIALSPTGMLNPEASNQIPSILWVVRERINGHIAELKATIRGEEGK